MERQDADPRSTLSLARRLASLRRQDAVLQSGEERSIDAGDDLLGWVRIGAGGRALLAIVNFAAAERPFSCPPDLPVSGRLVLSTDPDRPDGDVDCELELEMLRLAPGEGLLIALARARYGQELAPT